MLETGKTKNKTKHERVRDCGPRKAVVQLRYRVDRGCESHPQ